MITIEVLLIQKLQNNSRVYSPLFMVCFLPDKRITLIRSGQMIFFAHTLPKIFRLTSVFQKPHTVPFTPVTESGTSMVLFPSKKLTMQVNFFPGVYQSLADTLSLLVML